MKKLYVIGIGPGGIEHMSIKARKSLEESEVIVGYVKYIDMIKSLIEGKEVYATGMKGEEERCKQALSMAESKTVSIVSTGDAGIYGMAGLILELCKEEDMDSVEVIPGITAASAAASMVGAPLMHDNCNISLSDLMTPYSLIKKRVELAASADFVISLYNPKSKGRPNYLRECIDIIKTFRKGSTPVAIVKNALRDGEKKEIFTLDTFEDTNVDMFTIVIIGNSESYIKGNKFLTPRGYLSR
ncbi:precorrin-3B C(17)-methyltransferase [Clostridium algidicarnis]|uniref:precorrin-3B C(17)-methyltransferase n=1 Tax=Clostridium algidicarnis TaxID=37659 RepID=UPI001C0C9365|nr:precorrin-3B C(17)-methyltransferase [Clostridium algidicarnis]MBU3195302.1 precorrin-3B C(17)-methyltransferase [Clostridium algidicarnis]